MKVNRYPCCSATPAHTTLAEAPINVPLPLKKFSFFYNFFSKKILPPKHAPNAKAHTSGCKGNPNFLFSAREIAILIIIVVKGILSTKADAMADT